MPDAVTIQAPHLLSARQRARDTVLTSLLWFVYAYLWLPVVSLCAWLAGIDFAYDAMARAGGLDALTDLLGWYSFGIALIWVLVLAWSGNERRRFRGRNRRQAPGPVSDREVQTHAGLDDTAFGRLRSGGRVEVRCHADGRVTEVTLRR